MIPATVASITIRVRRMFLEEIGAQSTDFISTNQEPFEILDGYDQGCQWQQMAVIDAAEKSGRLEDHDCSFLTQYIARKNYTISRGQSEYFPVPDNVARIIKFTVNGIRGIRISPDRDRIVRQWPSYFGSAKGQLQWALLSGGIQSPPDPDDTERVIRVYEYGDTIGSRVNVPMYEMEGRLVYYRQVIPIALTSPPVIYTDCIDPWNEGPCYWSCARILEKAKQGEKADRMYTNAKMRFAAILPPPPMPNAGGAA